MSLTDMIIRNVKPRDKAFRLFDGGGLYLEVAPAGGKWWRIKYRFNKKDKRISLGTYPETTLKEARIKHLECRKLLRDDIDPSEHRKAKKLSRAGQAANSFESVAREWFNKHAPKWAENHSSRIITRFEKDIFPFIGKRPIAEITAPELLNVVQRIENRGAVDTAHRALGDCGQVFRYAIVTSRATRDTAADLRGALAPAIEGHFSAVTDPQKLGNILRMLDGFSGTFTVRCALRLAPLVFLRPGELRQAEWSEIDFEHADWNIPGEKTKTRVPHIVPLARQAFDIFKEVQALTGEGRFVFPNGRTPGGSRPMSENAVLAAMRYLGIPKEEMTPHGFRAMARTIIDEVLQVRPDFIEAQLAHRVSDPLGRSYNRTVHLDERRKMMQKWADYLDGLKAGAKVIPFKKMKES